MKLKNFDQLAVTFLLYGILLLALVSCQKDEEPQRPAHYEIEIKDVGESEQRTGGHQFVFFPSSFTYAHTLLNLYPQMGFNPTFTDSIVLEKIYPEVLALIDPGNGVKKFCALYETTIYQQDIFPTYIIAYAPDQFPINHIVYLPQGNGYGNLMYFFEFQKSPAGWQERFDFLCLKTKRDYVYRVNEVYQDTSITWNRVLPGNYLCNDLHRVKMVW